MKWLRGFRKWIWTDLPADEQEGIETSIKSVLRVICLVISGFSRHQLELRASALTYMVILSIVPVLAMGTALVKGLGADNYMKQAAYKMLSEMEAISEPQVFTTNTTASNATAETFHSQATKHLKVALDKIFEYVDRTNFATLGWLGVIVSLLTVIALMAHIEEAMNTIWETKKAREMGRKMIDYIGLIVLMPLSINIAFWAITANQSKAFLEKMTSSLKISWILPLVIKLLPFLIIIGTFSILYCFMPNTWVRWRNAAIGGMVGGVGWIAAQTLYIKMQIGVARYNAIYGSFASLPLFIFWVYVGWIIFLMGAETTYAVQNLKRLNPLRKPLTPLDKLALALDVLYVTYECFESGRKITADLLCDRLGRPLPEVDEVLESLLEAQILVKTANQTAYLPAMSPQKLNTELIFKAVCGPLDEIKTPGEKLAARIYRKAVETATGFSKRNNTFEHENGRVSK